MKLSPVAMLFLMLWAIVAAAETYHIQKAKRTGENELTVWMTTPTAEYMLTCKFRDDVTPVTPETATLDRTYTSCGISPDGLELLDGETVIIAGQRLIVPRGTDPTADLMFARRETDGKYAGQRVVRYAFDVAEVEYKKTKTRK